MRSLLSPVSALAVALLCSCASPTPPPSPAPAPTSPQAISAPSRLDQLQQEQYRLLAEIRYELAMMEPRVRAMRGDDTESIRFRETYERLRREFSSIEAEVHSDESGRTAYLSAGSRQPALVDYYSRIRIRIEQEGTLNFPKTAGGSAYGTAAVLLSLDSQGNVTNVEVVQSSSALIRAHAE